MALIICPECGKEVSDKAKMCIHCGYPLEELSEREKESLNEDDVVKIEETNADNRSGDICILDGKSYSKEKIKSMIKQDTIWNFLLEESMIPEEVAFDFMDVVNFYNGEIPTDYKIGYKELQRANKAMVAEMTKNKPKIHCKYCGSDNVRPLGPFEKLAIQHIGKEWHCKKCNSDF